MARGERIELSQSDLESNSPSLGTLPRVYKLYVNLKIVCFEKSNKPVPDQ
jgi:hypothetical protein